MKYYSIAILMLVVWACENRSLTEGEEFKPREIHEDIAFHFDKIEVDGVEYLILEKDNNNPHEGFGFMAIRGNILIEKQDTVTAYVKTINAMQIEMYSKVMGISLEQAQSKNSQLLNTFLTEEEGEIRRLQSEEYSSSNTVINKTTSEEQVEQ